MNWLKELKKGDLVIKVKHPYESIVMVQRTTKTQIILDGGRKFDNASGKIIGGGRIYEEALSKATPEKLKQVRAKTRRSNLVDEVTTIASRNAFMWPKFTNEELENIIEISKRKNKCTNT